LRSGKGKRGKGVCVVVGARGCAGGGRRENRAWGTSVGEIIIASKGILNHRGDGLFLMGDVTFAFIENCADVVWRGEGGDDRSEVTT
jgi:hypothetical protein